MAKIWGIENVPEYNLKGRTSSFQGIISATKYALKFLAATEKTRLLALQTNEWRER